MHGLRPEGPFQQHPYRTQPLWITHCGYKCLYHYSRLIPRGCTSGGSHGRHRGNQNNTRPLTDGCFVITHTNCSLSNNSQHSLSHHKCILQSHCETRWLLLTKLTKNVGKIFSHFVIVRRQCCQPITIIDIWWSGRVAGFALVISQLFTMIA